MQELAIRLCAGPSSLPMHAQLAGWFFVAHVLS